MCILTWDDVKEYLKDKNNAVLLGNGFSMSYQMPNFNQAEIIKEMPSLKDMQNIVNIEKCIKDTVALIRDDETKTTIPKNIIEEWIAEKLRQEFIKTLFNRIPQSLRDVEDGYNTNKIKQYKKFFSYFNQVFTLNYDPLIYWMFLTFMNYGEQDFLNLIYLKENIEHMEINTKEYKDKYKEIEKITNKCQNNVKKNFIENYICQKNDNYSIKIFYKDSEISSDSISNANYLSKKVYEKIYDSLSCIKEEDSKDVYDEKQNIDNCINKSIDTKTNELKANRDEFHINLNDGFINKKWNINNINNQNLYFLHGAMHIFESGDTTCKIQSDDEGKMLDNVEKAWNKNYKSLVVLEGNAGDKINRIESSNYLKACFDKFQTISGNLVTMGVAFENSDNHIIDAIYSNVNIKDIYIGGYTEDEIRNKMMPKFKENKKVKYFITKDLFKY